MTQEKIEQLAEQICSEFIVDKDLAEQICSEFIVDKDTTSTFGVDFDREDIINALIAMADEVIESIIKELPTNAEVEAQVNELIPYGYGSEDYYDGLKVGIKWAFNWLKNNI